MRGGDDALLARCSALLRLAEQLERSRDQLVREARLAVDNGHVRLELVHEGDVSVAAWAAERQRDLFRRAFGRELGIDAQLAQTPGRRTAARTPRSEAAVARLAPPSARARPVRPA